LLSSQKSTAPQGEVEIWAAKVAITSKGCDGTCIHVARSFTGASG